jgi:hypothetical protein
MKCRYCSKHCSRGMTHCPTCGGANPVVRRRKSVWEVLWVLATIFFVFLLARKEGRPAVVARE